MAAEAGSSRSLRAEVEDLFHWSPPIFWFGFWRSLLKRAHQLIPFAVPRILNQLWEVPLGGESVDRLHVHEHSATEQIDPHLPDPVLTQARHHLGPGFAVVFLVAIDDPFAVLEHQRHPVALHSNSLSAEPSHDGFAHRA